MLKNFFKVAFRNMWRQKVYTFINVSGLGIGMAACILILLFVQDELSYDEYHENSDRIYRVTREWLNQNGETSLHLGHVAPPFGPLLENDFEGVVLNAVRFNSGSNPLMKANDKELVENRFFFVDEDVFDVFSWEMISGNPETALKEPNSLVITESTAEKYFGDKDPVGETMIYYNFGVEREMKINGVVEDTPLNSHFKFDLLCSFKTIEDFFGVENLMRNWGSNNYATYLLFPEGYDIENFKSQLPDFMEKHLGPTQTGAPRWETNKLNLWKITDIHLHSNLDSEIEANSDIAYVYIYTIIAVFILAIACINFMNLSTARSAKRAQEVGLRKVMGAHKKLLVKQFITESVIFAVLGLVLAVIIVMAALPSFNDFVNKGLSIDILNNKFAAIVLIGITMIVGLVAGSYPAFYLSRFEAASILKGEYKSTGKTSISIRSFLVVFQFFISIILIISVAVVQDQLQYMRTKDLGFDKENIVILPSSGKIYNQFESMKKQLESHDGIIEATLGSRVPSGRLLDSQGSIAEVDGEMKQINFRIADVHVDHDYLESFGVEFAAGRNFDREIASDSTEAFIINEATVRAIRWESNEAAIGKQFNYGNRKGRIIGVVEDFHFESLHQPIAPIVFLVTSGRNRSVIVKLVEGKEKETLDYLKEQWSYWREGFPFTYTMVNDRFDQQYNDEARLHSVIKYFSVLAIIIASLGLFGLASFTAEQKVKEIGIRKVLGASAYQILVLLTGRFTRLVFIAFVLAIPVSWYFMDQWLNTFAYRGNIEIWSFILAGIIAMSIAWITVGSQTIKAARVNPVDSIKYE